MKFMKFIKFMKFVCCVCAPFIPHTQNQSIDIQTWVLESVVTLVYVERIFFDHIVR